MLKPFKTLSEIPLLIQNVKSLLEANCISITNSKKVLHQCSFYADKCRKSKNIEKVQEAQKVIRDLIKFSRWLKLRDTSTFRIV